MAFSFRKFVMKGLKMAIGYDEDYQIIRRAAGWFDKGVLKEEDLIEIQALIDAKNGVTETEDGGA